MKNFQKLFLTILTATAFTLTGCLHIIEDVTFRDSGKGSYKMTIDMSEVKGMMEMMKGMAPADSTGEGGGIPDGSMGQMGQGLSDVAASLKGVQGISNVVETNDTSAFKFGYTFDFDNAAALNRALKVINKDKFQSNTDEVFKFTGKSFERLGFGDIGSEMKKAMSESEAGDEAGGMDTDMIKNFFGDMTYKQIYHFPDREIKKSSNELGEVSEDKHSLTITLKPFDEEQAKKKATVATEIKLK